MTEPVPFTLQGLFSHRTPVPLGIFWRTSSGGENSL